MNTTIGPFRVDGWTYQLFPRHAMMLVPDGRLMIPANYERKPVSLYNDGWGFARECTR
jgi:hypothetical protein